MPGSCSSGFRSRPSGTGGHRRSNGLLVKSVNSKKPALTKPITARMRANTTLGNAALNVDTACIHKPSIKIHSKSDPSCPPQMPATR
jgi:hypothetical protein